MSFLAARSLTAACVEDTFLEPEQLTSGLLPIVSGTSPRIAVTAIAGLFFAAHSAGDTRSPLR